MTFLVIRTANNARKLCEEKNIISSDQKILRLDDLTRIINLFGGKLEESFDDKSFLKKDSDKNFTIYFKLDDKKRDYTDDIFTILKGLGQAFFKFKSLNINETCDIEDISLENIDTYELAEIFARTFIMPEDLYLDSVIKYTDDAKVNVNSVAKEFKINYFEVLNRGSELKIF